MTAQSVAEPDELKIELQRILGRGYATDDQEYHQDVRCLAAPIRDERGAVVAAELDAKRAIAQGSRLAANL